MKNTTAIVLVVILSIILIGLLIYGFVFLPKQQNKILPGPTTPPNTTTNSGGTGTNTNGGTTTNTPTPSPTPSQYIKDLAQEFRTQFQCSSCASNRCTVIGKVNDLSNLDLVLFSNYYKTKFLISPKDEMDDAWVWCATNNVDNALYSKLSVI